MRPHYIHNGHLILRNGAFDIAEIPLSDIDSIEKSTREVSVKKGEVQPLGVSFPAGHNVVLRLKTSLEARILNRKRREFNTALLFADDVLRLIERLTPER